MAKAPSAVVLDLNGGPLDLRSLAEAARAGSVVTVDPQALARVSSAHATALEVSTRRGVYGMTTGVGANRHQSVDVGAGREHGLRVLRSHAVGFGPVDDSTVTRAAMLVRLNQLLNAGSSASPAVVLALADALNAGAVPTLHRLGTIGTGDLAPLAGIALTLAGEWAWSAGGPGPVPFDAGDALAFISSNAVTASVAVLAWDALDGFARAACVVAALSFAALQGSAEAYAEQVHRGRPGTGAARTAATMRRLLAAGSDDAPSRRLQDPYGLRAVPQVHGPAVEALSGLERVLVSEISSPVENPLVSVEQATVLHHGQFYTGALAAALDAVRGTLYPVLALSAARLTALQEPALTGLTPFLAGAPAGSSGTMVLEYVVHDVLAQGRLACAPVSLGGAVLSRGLEEHASFSPQAARATALLAALAPVVLGCELLCAVRALRAAPDRLTSGPVRAAFDLAAAVVPDDPEDRPLGEDLAGTVAVLPSLAAL